MSDATRVLHRFCFAILAVGGLSASALADDHLLLSEVCPSDAYEFIEIYNPLGVPVDLTNYYLSDSPIYCRRPQQIPPVPSPGDFVVQFPLGSSIGPGARKVIALNGTAFATHFGFDADFEFPPGEGDPDGPAANMVGPYPGSLNLPNIGNTGEGLTMFFWNGASDLVQDVDILRAGQPSAGDDVQSKTGISVDGPDPDSVQTFYVPEAITMPAMTLNAGATNSYKRRFLEGTNEYACGGNGITGNQELSENIAINWDGNVGPLTLPNPGTGVNLSTPPGQCFADIVHNNAVDVNDLLAVISTWGACGDCQACPADIAPSTCHDCTINVNDLLAVITTWGACP